MLLVGYLATWSGGGDQAIAAVKTAGARIQRTADRILSALDGGVEASSESVGAADT